MFTQEELFVAMQQLEIPEQVTAIEAYLREEGLNDESATVLSMVMMNVMIDLDGGNYPADLIERVQTITTTIRDFNEQRFSA